MYVGRQLKCDSDEELEEVKNKSVIFQTKNELLQKKKLFMNLGSKLPDNGAKLRRDIEKLEMKLKDLELTLRREMLAEEICEGNQDERCLKEGVGHARNAKKLDQSMESICSGINSISVSNKTGESGVSVQRDTETMRNYIAKASDQKSKTFNNLECQFSNSRGKSVNQHPVVSQSPEHTNFASSQQKKLHGGYVVKPQKETVCCGRDVKSAPKSHQSITNINNSQGDEPSEDHNCDHEVKQTITLKTKEDSGIHKNNRLEGAPVVTELDTCSAIQNVVKSDCNQSLTFSDLRKELESPEMTKLSDVKHCIWKDWRDQSVKLVKLTEAQPLPSDPRVYVPKQASLGTCAMPKQNRIRAEEVAKMHELLKTLPSEQDDEEDPAGLRTKLMVHQKRALTWLVWREKQTPSGGIFADDMGLGKTLTMLSLILKQKNSLKRDQSIAVEGSIQSKATLIVCLASVMHQWKAEVEKHFHSQVLNVLVYHGKGRMGNIENITDYDIVVTTYGIINSEGKSLACGSQSVPPLFQIHWERIILDEAHTIKNAKCSTSKCVYLLEASCRWAVTGTPIHNDVRDLYSLLKFMQYSPFDDYKVWKNFVGDHTQQCVERRNTLIKGILFRRTKDQCDESGKPLVILPKKTVIKHELKLSEVERKVYTLLYEKSKARMRNYLEARHQKSCSTNGADQNYLVALLRLQQCCNHISLLKGAVEDDVPLNNSDISRIADDIASLSIESNKNSNKSADISFSLDVGENFSVSFPSTKIKALFKQLKKIEKVDENQKSIIVSQWVAMLEIVEHHLKEHGMEYIMIRGNTKPEDRTNASLDFNENPKGPKILLLSLKAGGVGLNLIGGNHLFLLDHHWNPALESQACDRIYRVGQLQDVYIHKFLCNDTIEITIATFQEQKSNDARITLECGKNVAKKLSFEDLKLLFGIN